MYQCTFCARMAYFLGCHTIILTNAAGGAIKHQTPGSVVIMTDYIRDVYYNVMNHSRNDSMFGNTYATGNNLFDKELINIFESTANEVKFPYYKGCYWWSSGPAYETSTQIQYIIKSGGHAVGMSTVPSLMASNNLGLRVGCLSLCTNVAAGLADEPLSHDIVVAEAAKAGKSFSNFVEKSLLKIKDPSNWKEPKIGGIKLINYNKPYIFNDDLFPRKYLTTYHDLYKDISFLRSFLTNILDLEMELDDTELKDDTFPLTSETVSGSISSVNLWDMKNLNNDVATLQQNVSSITDMSELSMIGNELQGNFNFSVLSNDGTLVTRNRKGPIVVWLLHEPFTYDKSNLMCPIVFPLDLLPGWNKISSSSSGKQTKVYFGLDRNSNFIVIVTGLGLEGWRFDESNYFINLIYGVVGHKNIFFFNLFYSFDVNKLYNQETTTNNNSNNNDIKSNNDDIDDEKYGLILDAIDFGGGFPRYPFPLFPPTDYNTMNSHVRIKYANFGNNKSKSLQLVMKCIKATNNNTTDGCKVFKYGYWPGPNFPTKSELNMTKQGNCNVIGISDPFMTPMCRQLGSDGYSIAKIANNKTLNNIFKIPSIKMEIDETQFINTLTSKIIDTFLHDNSNDYKYSPALKNRIRKGNLVNDKLLYDSMYNINVPKAPQYYKIRSVKHEWNLVEQGSIYLNKYWNFDKKPINNALFCSFSHLFELKSKLCVCTVNLSELPGWKENFCGGYPYSHYHWNNINPFEWYLKIFKYNNSNNEYYICISPMFFNSDKIMKSRKKLLSSFYKYSPMFWNLNHIVKILWKCNIKSVNYICHLMSNDSSIKQNSVVCINNFVETAKWNCLTGPNDIRIGPRFTPITDPFEYCHDIIKYTKNKYNKIINQVKVSSLSHRNIVSKLAKLYYAKMGYPVSVCGLGPCIYQTQHCGLKKFALGIVDYDNSKNIANMDSFKQIIHVIEDFFLNIS